MLMWCNSRISLAFINLSLAQTFSLFQYAYVLHVVTLQSKLDCYLLVCTLFTSMYLVCSLHFLNVCYIFWCIWPPKKFDEDKIQSRQNLTLCYKWQIWTCSLSKCWWNMHSCRHFLLASILWPEPGLFFYIVMNLLSRRFLLLTFS